MSGFTLVEILVAALILSFVAMGILAVLYVGDTSWHSGMAWLDLQQGVRSAVDGISREARGGNISTLSISANNTRVDFYLPGVSNAISYYLSDSQLLREHPAGTTKVLSNNIDEISFCCLGGANCTDCANANSLNINITAEKTEKDRVYNFSLIEKVMLRND